MGTSLRVSSISTRPRSVSAEDSAPPRVLDCRSGSSSAAASPKTPPAPWTKRSARSDSSPKESKDHLSESDDEAIKARPETADRTNDVPPHGVKGRLRDSAALNVLTSDLRPVP